MANETQIYGSYTLHMPLGLFATGERVVLLHGLIRSPASMEKLEGELVQHGFEVSNIGYPSREFPIEELSTMVKDLITDENKGAEKIHVVTHSMGGIIIRYIQENDPIEKLGRVVMLSPPNGGSEVVDKLGDSFLYDWINGPAGSQLGTDETSLVSQWGPVEFELGIITGDRSINLILSTMIPGDDDGKVSIESAKVEGMKAFKVVHASHPFIMKKDGVIQDTILFLREGRFTEEKND